MSNQIPIARHVTTIGGANALVIPANVYITGPNGIVPAIGNSNPNSVGRQVADATRALIGESVSGLLTTEQATALAAIGSTANAAKVLTTEYAPNLNSVGRAVFALSAADSVIKIGKQMAHDRIDEAVIEAAKSGAQMVGAIGGAKVGAEIGLIAGGPYAVPIAAGAGAAIGLLTTAELADAIARRARAPEPPGNEVDLEPAIVLGGFNYYIVDGELFVGHVSRALTSRYGPISEHPDLRELTDAYLQVVWTPDEREQYHRELAAADRAGRLSTEQIEELAALLPEDVSLVSFNHAWNFRTELLNRDVSETTVSQLDIYELTALSVAESGGKLEDLAVDLEPLPDYAIEVGLLYQQYKQQGYSIEDAYRAAQEGALAYDATEGPTDALPPYVVPEPAPGVPGFNPADDTRGHFIDDGDLYIDAEVSSAEWVPPPQFNPPSSGPPATYTVEPGDSLWSIAQKTGIPFQEVLAANTHLAGPDLILPGDIVNLSLDTAAERYIDGDLWDATEGPPGTYSAVDPFSMVDFSAMESTAGSSHTFHADKDVWDPEKSPDDVGVWWSDHGGPFDASSEQPKASPPENSGAMQAFSGSLNSAYNLYNAIEGGDTLSIASSGLRFAQSIEGFKDVQFDSATSDGVSNMSASIGLAGSAWGFYQAIDRGDALGASSAGLVLAQQGTALYASAAASSSQAAATAAQSTSAALGMAAGAIGVVSAAVAGDFIGMVASVMMMIPGMQMFGVALAIANAMGLFGGDPEPYEAPSGDGHFTRTGNDDVGVAASGSAGSDGDLVRASLAGRMGELQQHLSETPSGGELIRVAMQETLRALRADLPDDAAIIPERLPGLSFNGYFYVAEFADPDTAHMREVAIAPADAVDTLTEIARYSQAVAPQWEADTVTALYEAGDPQFWYTEEQRAFVESGGASAGAFMPIVLDLSGDEVLSGDALVYFDVDDDNYKELSQWVSPQDGVLALDHDFDGRIDAASELFSNPALAAAYRGLGALAWLDVNDDGIINAQDPVFDALRLWQDANADGISDLDELTRLSDAGITRLQYAADAATGEFHVAHAKSGAAIAMASAALAAEAQGVRIEHRPGGVLVEKEGGGMTFHVTEAIDLGPNETQSRNIPGTPQTILIDTGDMQRELRSAADAAARATPFGAAGAGLLAFGIGFGNSQADTLEPDNASRTPPSDAKDVIAAGTNAGAVLGEPILAISPSAEASDAEQGLSAALTTPAATGDAPSAGGPLFIGTATTDAPVLGPRASFGGLPDLLLDSEQASTAIPLAAGTPLEGPSNADRASLGDTLNGGPLAGDDVLATSEDAVTLITQAALLGNDADFSKTGVMAITAVRNAEHGSVSMDADGLIRFTPEHNYYGEASFEYVVTNSRGRSDVGTATIHVAPVNDIPIVASETVTAIEDIPALFAGAAAVHPLLRNDSDVEADLLSISAVSNARHGAVSLASDNTVTFIPDANYFGAAQFDYTVSDGNGGEATATAFVDVTSVNDAPQFTGTVYMGGLKGGLLASDVDNPPSDLLFSVAQHPLNGAASIDALTGIWTYSSTPCNPYNGADPFTVAVTDPDGASATTTVDTRHLGTTCTSGKKPLIVDLDGDGLEIVGIDDSTVFFDVNDDGWREKIAWAGPEDGLLAYDKNADGAITDYDEISFVSYLDGARTDLEGLQGFDSNEDSLLTPLDRDWDAFGIWQDTDQDGITDTGEFTSLGERGITDIALDGERQHEHYDDGSVLFGTTTYTQNNGSTGLIGDVRLAYDASDIIAAEHDLNEFVELPRSAAESFDRQEAVAAPQDGYEAGELEREVTQLRSDMAAFEASFEELPSLSPDVFEFTIAVSELDESEELVT